MANTPFKLKSGNSPLFKRMGSSPMQHGVENPDTGKKEYRGHSHEGMTLTERLGLGKFKETALGKAGTQIKSTLGEIKSKVEGAASKVRTTVSEDIKKKKKDIKSLETDILTKKELGTTKKLKEKEEEEKKKKKIVTTKKKKVTAKKKKVTTLKSHAGDPYSYRRTEDGGYEYRKGKGSWIKASGKGLEAIKKRYE